MNFRMGMALTIVYFTFSAAGLLAAEKTINEMNELVDTLGILEKEVKNSGVIDPGCPNCVKIIEPNEKLSLTSKNTELERLWYRKDNQPFIVHLKRTKDSPLKTTIKYKNGHSECGKMMIGTNPWIANGPLVMGCIFTITVYEENEIDLDLRKFPLPEGNEEQIIELKFVKPDLSRSSYTLDATVLKGPDAKIKKSKKFWSEGFDLTLDAPESVRP